MIRQQKVRDALVDVVDVLAVATNELAFCYLRLGWSTTGPERMGMGYEPQARVCGGLLELVRPVGLLPWARVSRREGS